MVPRIPRALTIAGSDSGGGAGIQADLKTFAALGVYGTSAITALTAQNTSGVRHTIAVRAEFVQWQIESVLEDIGADAVKTGMLFNLDVVEVVSYAALSHGLPNLVVDPVLVSKHGDTLLGDNAVETFKTLLLPRAFVVTPNVPEAERLVGFRIRDRESRRRAAKAIARMGPRFVVLKGGHLADSKWATDLVYDGRKFEELRAPRSASPHTHGTGCVFSAAIAAHLALGREPREAIARAKEFVTHAIEHGLAVGGGIGPVNPTWEFENRRSE